MFVQLLHAPISAEVIRIYIYLNKHKKTYFAYKYQQYKQIYIYTESLHLFENFHNF